MNTNRVFPFVGVADSSKKSQVGEGLEKFLSFDSTGLYHFQKITGWRISPERKPSWLFSLLNEAIEYETEGNFVAADFCFQKLYKNLEGILADNSLFSKNNITYENWLKELFLDTHLALLRGYYKKEPNAEALHRIKTHLTYIGDIATYLSSDEFATLKINIARLNLLLITNQEGVNQGLNLGQRYLDESSSDTSMTSAILEEAYYLISQAESNDYNQFIVFFEKNIEHVSNFNPVFDLLTFLLLLKVKNNSVPGRLSIGLLAIQKAAILSPDHPEIDQIRLDLEHKAKALSTQIFGLESSLVDKSILRKGELSPLYKDVKNLQINLKKQIGNYAQLEDKRYYAIANEIAPEISQNQSLFFENKHAWKRIIFGIRKMMSNSNSAGANLETDINNLTSIYAIPIADLPEKIRQYLVKRKSQFEKSLPDSAREPDFSWISYSLDTQTTKKPKNEIPIGHWLYSKKGLWVKTIAASVIAFMCLTSILSLKHYSRKMKRDSAFTALYGQGSQNDDFPLIAKKVTLFLDNPPLFSSDYRKKEVKELFEETFSDWFLKSPQLDSTKIIEYKSIYQKLSNSN